jgi:hypothetical protein
MPTLNGIYLYNMATIPTGQKFHTVPSNVVTQERGSALANSQREIYTMQDIIDTVGDGGGGASGIHALVKPTSTTAVCQQLVASGFGSTAQTANRLVVAPFIPATSFTSSNLFIRVITGVSTALAKIVVYSDLNSIPNNLIYASTDLDCSTVGTKTATTSISFVAGNLYWVGVFTSSTQAIFTFTAAQTYSFNVTGSIPAPANALSAIVSYGPAPNPAPELGSTLTTIPMVGITGT